MSGKQKLTTNAGAPVPDNQNVMTAGKRGPQLLQDTWFLEKLARFDREVIPERRMHAKGSGAFGTFTVTQDITKDTKASVFAQMGKQTDLFVRFLTGAGERGAADAERDIRDFAVKFYTDQGSYHRDGAMRVDGNYGGTRGYEPNSYGEWRQQPEFAEPPLKISGDAPKMIKLRHIGNGLKADPAYGKGVADALGIPLSEVPKA